MAIWILLLSQATHDMVDHRHLTPESAAIRAGNEDATTLLATWPVAKQKYRNSEFVQEWMKFICDPDANLDTDLTAKEVLAQVRMEEHEESTAVRARGGHLLIDEIITGPVLCAEERARAKIVGFSASDSVSMATAPENSSVGAQSLSNGSCTPSPWRTRGGHENECVDGPMKGGGRHDAEGEVVQAKTKSKLGKELDVYLAQARDETAGVLAGGAAGESSAYSRLLTKEQLEGRRKRWPGIRDNGKDPPTGGAGPGCSADSFGRPMTTSQRRRVAALEVAEDGGWSKQSFEALVRYLDGPPRAYYSFFFFLLLRFCVDGHQVFGSPYPNPRKASTRYVLISRYVQLIRCW